MVLCQQLTHFNRDFKSLISLKTRNILYSHPRAKIATNRAAQIVLDAAIAAGAPKDIIGWIDSPSVELSNALMHHPDINLILATADQAWSKLLIVLENLQLVLVLVTPLSLLMKPQILACCRVYLDVKNI